ncbi:MAG TPA: hypothetical protein PLD54_00600 [Candidatus Levybacteria bacterium]|nr:hypothetical protein [Candidatus Levybacteria bacterium]
MDKRFILLGVYFLATPLVLFVFIFYALYYHHEHTISRTPSARVLNYNGNFEALPDGTVSTAGIDLGSQDARINALEVFFARHKSPLKGHGKKIVVEADKHGFDYRLLPAIAMQESNLCKKVPKEAKNNCWGFGIYGKKRTSFDSFDDAIRIVSKTLANSYIDNGLETPEQIMSKYTPNSNGSWAEGVTYFMDRIHADL